MKLSYYPGCTLKTKAKDLDAYGRRAAEALGITLEEIPDWQCCGGTFTMSEDEIATKLSSVRALVQARAAQSELVTLCSACHNVIKRTNYAMKNDANMNLKANNYLQLDEPYNGETQVIHYLEMLRDKVGFDKIKEKVVKPLEGKKIAAYYGCLLLRPGKVMAMDDPENPKIMENLISALGAEPVVYPYRNECCGGYLALEDKELVAKKSGTVMNSASNAGADIIITACPLCLYNLKKNRTEDGPEILYFTELLAEALGVKEV